jgi:dTDP-4-dehydrorhamnose reductase
VPGPSQRLVVTGSTGRLGSAVIRAAGEGAWQVTPWTRADFDLDAPEAVAGSLARDRPEVVVHCAAWTDVDGCASDPELAEQRNGRSTGVLARACAERGIALLAVSSNEVFDGRRTDRLPYQPDDVPSPGNAYGRSKRSGELAALSAAEADDARLWIVRTAWLFGPPAPDFPVKIAAAAHRAAAAGQALRLVDDEIGTPTSAADLAGAILDLVRYGSPGIHHVVNAGQASRAAWARLVLAELGLDLPTEAVSLDDWPRPSRPPRWGVLAATPLPGGALRSWQDAVREDLRSRPTAFAA